MSQITQLALLFGFAWLAFWQKNAVLFLLDGIIATFAGLSWYNATPVTLAIAIVLISYSLFCIGMAIRYVWFREEEEED